MVEMINASSGNHFLVAEDRVEEYLARGHQIHAQEEEKPKQRKTTKAKK